jgi:hypothetical protein
MKIYFTSPPTAISLHGWKRLVRRFQNAFHATLVVETGRGIEKD